MDPETLSLTDIIKLQTQLSEVLKRRFEKHVALVSSDIVGSTTYFATHGDEAGRRLQQRHFDVLDQIARQHGGRIVDTAGDGALLAFPAAVAAAHAVIELEERITQQNALHARADQLEVRVGIHWGPVLTDGVLVTGDSVNLCGRIAGTANASEIRINQAAFAELTTDLRLRCAALPPTTVPGLARPLQIMRLEWLDRRRFPSRCRIRESGYEVKLPAHDTITFGRLGEQNGIVANDIVLALKDTSISQQVSRWHFELRRYRDGFKLRSVTDRATEVDGVPVVKPSEVDINPRSVVRVGNVLTIEFLPDPTVAGDSDSHMATTF